MVDFWQLHKNDELELMEERNLYPPRMKLTIGELSSGKNQILTMTFKVLRRQRSS